jgi:transposase
MFLRTTTYGSRTYLLLVKSVRINGKPKQILIANLGRLDILQSTGEIDKLCQAFGKFSSKTVTISEDNSDDIEPPEVEMFGPVIVFQTIWTLLGISSIINSLSANSNYQFNHDKVIFSNVLQRLIDPGSDKTLSLFLDPLDFPFKNEFKPQQSYKVMDWLGKPLKLQGTNGSIIADSVGSNDTSTVDPESESDPSKKGKEPKRAVMVRTISTEIEELLFSKRKDVLTHERMYFYDTTSFFFYGKGGETLGRRGHSKDRMSDRPQVVLGAVLDDKGFPVCTELWPGNTADVTTLLPIAERLKSRFGIEKVCMVADRGMISKFTIQSILNMGWSYILGVKMRQCVDMPQVFADESPYFEITKEREKSTDPAPLKVKSININGIRYVICLNDEEARKDAYDRALIIENLGKKLKSGDKSIISNDGFRKFVASSKGKFSIDYDKVSLDSRYDGLYILTTNLNIPPEQVAQKYKQLISVESLFKGHKSIVNTRPIYHSKDNNIRGHVWISFLALLMKHYLIKEINSITPEGEPQIEWGTILAALKSGCFITIESNGKKMKMMSKIRPELNTIFKALNIKMPHKVIPIV